MIKYLGWAVCSRADAIYETVYNAVEGDGKIASVKDLPDLYGELTALMSLYNIFGKYGKESDYSFIYKYEDMKKVIDKAAEIINSSKGTGTENKNTAGKYEVCFEEYDRGYSSNVRTKRFTAKSDLDAFIKLVKHSVGPFGGWLIEDNGKIYDPDNEEMVDASGLELDDDGCVTADCPLGDYWEGSRVYSTVEDVIKELDSSNGDGCDYIFYIKKPDGSMLYGDENSVSDWDDED